MNSYAALIVVLAILATPTLAMSVDTAELINSPIDVSPDFANPDSSIFVARKLTDFDPATGEGRLQWKRSRYRTNFLFNNMDRVLEDAPPNEFPRNEYDADPALPFSMQFVSPRTIRLRLRTSHGPSLRAEDSLMLAQAPPRDGSWKATRVDKGYEFRSDAGRLVLREDPWAIELYDSQGRLATRTRAQSGSLPFSFVRRASDYSRSVAAVFSLAADEKIFGCGEGFGPLNKRGQKVVLWTSDVLGAERELMYKPVPFFLSSRGYGMFVHTSAPTTFDFGSKFISNATLSTGDDELDLFIFLGSPTQILNEYTSLVGKAAMPPLWSFGLWMSRITYSSETQVREVAAKLRQHKIPCDVIHLDTGWFQTDWRCDYQFAADRFPDPAKMIRDLREQGFRISLWQLPYFVPKNRLFPEIVANGLAVKNAAGGLPGEDAVLDFSNPKTVQWYQDHLASLLKLGVGAIKVDFGEAAPKNGLYASGRTGFYEHNLYPLRYQKAVADITKQTTGDTIIWARAGWAGSQRYPLHWSGDSQNSDASMGATLRAGLSLGLSGFTFWSHDIGGFFGRPSVNTYKRWLAFGMLTSHSRCHGDPPREPWEYGDDFTAEFRAADELKYALMPYIYAQAKDSTQRGLPMTRALFVEFPDDPGAWLVDDQYMFGSDILVAPLIDGSSTSRNVYLPPGEWMDYQSKQKHSGGWHKLEAGAVAAIVLVRSGRVIPRVAVAQSTSEIDWNRIELACFGDSNGSASGLLCLPTDGQLRELTVPAEGGYRVSGPALGSTQFNVSQLGSR